MHRGMKQDQVRIGIGQASDCGLSSMRRAVVDHPEDALGGTVRLATHDLRNQASKGLDPGAWLATPHQDATSDVVSREVRKSAATIILELDTPPSPRGRAQGRMTADSRLDAGLLVGTDDAVRAPQRLTLPSPCVEVQDRSGFHGKPRVAWVDPVLVLPGFDSVGVQNAPNRAPADRLAQLTTGLRCEVSQRLAAQGFLRPTDQLASDRLDDGLIQGGKSGVWPRAPARPPRQNHQRPNVASSAGRSRHGGPPTARPRHWKGRVVHGGAGQAWPAGEVGTAPCDGARVVELDQESRWETQGGRLVGGRAWGTSMMSTADRVHTTPLRYPIKTIEPTQELILKRTTKHYDVWVYNETPHGSPPGGEW